ncbi:two-component system sensor histidine kinase NtrB [Metabacillus sp. YM-086]|uniref:two-component system sensor histidine kinase NtrB n=1 Tax=Metabacillus sp. YM-086 TaxID=3341729 RepID=UPI003A88C30F
MTNHIDFQKIVDQALSGILLLDQNRKIVYYNQTSLQLFNCEPEKLKDLKDFLHPDYHEVCSQRLNRVFSFHETAEAMEQKLVTYTKEIIDVEIKAIPYNLSDKTLALIYIRDITKQKLAEKLLSHNDKLASIGQISAGIAHEVRNPLTAVKGFTQLLKEQVEHNYLETIESELDKALSTLNNLLQVSKPDLIDEARVPIRLCQELDSIVFMFQEQLYNIEIHTDFKDRQQVFMGKKNILVKAFFNLIKNAIEAIEGEGKITIKHFVKDQVVHIVISDTGVGMKKEEIRLVGTPFFSSKPDGTGMGLTQVFTTVHQHQGEVHIDSVKGKGTCFYIMLPIL